MARRDKLLESPLPEAKKARAVGFNHVALEVGDIERPWRSTAACSLRAARQERDRRSSISAISSSRCRRAGRSPPMAAGISGWWSMTRRRSARRWPRRARTAARAVPRFPRPWGNRIEIVGYDNIQFTKAPTCCAAWGSPTSRRTRRRSRSSPTRAWRRTDARTRGDTKKTGALPDRAPSPLFHRNGGVACRPAQPTTPSWCPSRWGGSRLWDRPACRAPSSSARWKDQSR